MMKKEGLLCKVPPLSHHHTHAQSTPSRQFGPSRPLVGKTPCRPSLLGQQHSRPQRQGSSLSGHPAQRSQESWTWRICTVRHHKMPCCNQAHMTTYSSARKCPPSVGPLVTCPIRRRRQLPKGRGCKHPHSLAQLHSRSHEPFMSNPSTRPTKANSRPPTLPPPVSYTHLRAHETLR